MLTPADRRQRRRQGVFYSPPEAVGHILAHTVAAWRRHHGCDRLPRVLDPACGQGAFLLPAYRLLLHWAGEPTSLDDRLAIAREHLFGVDIDPAAVAITRRLVWEAAAGERRLAAHDRQQPGWERSLDDNFLVADALADADTPAEIAARLAAPPLVWPHRSQRRLGAGGFDCVVGNPPFVGIRTLTQTLPAEVKAWLQRRYATARGCFDLYVLFLERGLELLAAGGHFGWIVPSPWATRQYAAASRRLLQERTTITRLDDVSAQRLFAAANVYPLVLCGRREQPAGPQPIRLAPLDRWDTPAAAPDRDATAGPVSLASAAASTWAPRRATRPLASLAEVSAGLLGFHAARVAAAIVERSDAPTGDGWPLIVSRNIDPWRVTPGGVRFLRRTWREPWLPAAAAGLTAGKRCLFAGPKIVLAGLARRFEAAYDDRGYALGVQVLAVHSWRIEPLLLLALLNSAPVTHWWRSRQAARPLAGGYATLTRGELAQTPMPAEVDARRQRRLVELAAALHTFPAAEPDDETQRRLSREVDRLAAELYGWEVDQPEGNDAGALRA